MQYTGNGKVPSGPHVSILFRMLACAFMKWEHMCTERQYHAIPIITLDV